MALEVELSILNCNAGLKIAVGHRTMSDPIFKNCHDEIAKYKCRDTKLCWESKYLFLYAFSKHIQGVRMI